MKITVEKKTFLKALQIGGAFAGNNKVLPILECVKIKVGLEKLTIVSSDSENAVSKTVHGISSDSEYSFCVNMKDLLSYVKLITSDEFEMSKDGDMLTISHKNGNFTLSCESDDNFPVVKLDDNPIEVEMDAALLNNWIAYGKNFIGNDELRPVLSGLYIYCKDKEIGCCATNSYSLFTDNTIMENIPDFSFILNKNAFKAVCDAISDVEKVNIKIGSNAVLFVGNGVSVSARLIEGKYPNFKTIISSDNNIEVHVPREDMLNAISRCSVGASKASMLTKIKVDGFNMEISCEDLDFNKKTVEYLTVESNGNITIGFKSPMLTEIFNAITTDTVVVTMKEPSRPAVFKKDGSDSNEIFLLMPMLIE